MKERVEKLMSLAGEDEALLLTCEQTLRWLSGFAYTDGFVIVTRSRCMLFCDFRYIEAARAAVCAPTEVILTEKGRADAAALLRGSGAARVLYEDRFMTCAELRAWERLCPGVSFSPVGGAVNRFREFKDADELALICGAQRIAERAYEHILGFISRSRTEREVALELDYFMRLNGATGISFDTIAVSGEASSLPHGVPRDLPLREGFLTMDYGAELSGYRSDMTRTVCIGRADSEMRRVYETVLRAQSAAEGMLRAGVRCADVDRTARDIIDRAGYGGCFGHSLGHGVGLFIHEEPRLSPSSGDAVLCPGHIVTVEPGIYIEGRYGVRIEDMVFIGKESARIITDCPKELTELCV